MVQENNTQVQQDDEQAEAARVVQKLGIYALVRTALSSERSLMAWIRTCVSLYTFGFSITKFLDYLGKQQEVTGSSAGLYRLGFAIICIGILGLALAAFGHLQRLKKMKRLGLPTVSLISLPVVATTSLVLIGVAVLISIGLNWPL
jgi:putative membrane protein